MDDFRARCATFAVVTAAVAGCANGNGAAHRGAVLRDGAHVGFAIEASGAKATRASCEEAWPVALEHAANHFTRADHADWVGACEMAGSGGSSAHETSVYVSRSQYGNAWPLTIPRGTLKCLPEQMVVITYNGRTWAVNGHARGTHRFRDLAAIWADDPAFGHGAKKDVGPLIEKGLSLC